MSRDVPFSSSGRYTVWRLRKFVVEPGSVPDELAELDAELFGETGHPIA